MGWIRCASTFTLMNVNQVEVFEIGNKTNGAVIEALLEREEMVVSIGYFGTIDEAKSEIERLQAWLNDGAQGVYVVGEGPMETSGDSVAARDAFSRGWALGNAFGSGELAKAMDALERTIKALRDFDGYYDLHSPIAAGELGAPEHPDHMNAAALRLAKILDEFDGLIPHPSGDREVEQS